MPNAFDKWVKRTPKPIYSCGVCGKRTGPQHKDTWAIYGHSLVDMSSEFFEHIESLRKCKTCHDWAIQYIAYWECGIMLS